jgi:CubicO group peptidase (beta-lactamase class C family)
MPTLEENFTDQDRRFAPAFAVLEDAIARRAFPGAALAVVCRGRLLALKGFGRFTYDDVSPAVQPDTVYDLASVTKVVATTVAAMLLWQHGRFSLETPLAELLPEFGAAVAGDVAGAERGRVTLEHLLAHTSGLPAYEKLYLRAQGRAAMVAAACAVPLASCPEEHAEYSDLGFLLLGEALTRLTGERLGEFCHREIFAPLGMTRTTFWPESSQRRLIPPTEMNEAGNVIQGIVQDENARAYAGEAQAAEAGHAGLFAPARDVARLSECLLRGGEPILHPDTIALFTHRRPLPPGSSRALGWDTPSAPSQSGHYFTPASYGHLGYAGTSLWVDPARLLSVTLLTNRTWPDRGSELIRQVRPRFHDAVAECLRWRPAPPPAGRPRRRTRPASRMERPSA